MVKKALPVVEQGVVVAFSRARVIRTLVFNRENLPRMVSNGDTRRQVAPCKVYHLFGNQQLVFGVGCRGVKFDRRFTPTNRLADATADAGASVVTCVLGGSAFIKSVSKTLS